MRAVIPPLSMACLLALAGTLSAQSVPEKKEAEHGQFLRLVKTDDEQPMALETAIVRHVPRDCGQTGPTVDLISSVHIGEKSYYEELNRLFEKYDVVLYELVAPEGTRIPKGGPEGSRNMISMTQTGMTGLLGLEYQLRGVDYTAKNFVHADMSPEEFAKSMEQRGESMFQTFARMFGYALARQQGQDGATDTSMLMAFFSKNRKLALKRVMAEQFRDMEGSLTAINGTDGSTLITERNRKALEVLRKEIAAGKQKIAIFYGAGHMSDFQKRLSADFDLTPISTEWLAAWNLRE